MNNVIPFSINDLKDYVKDTLRAYLYPQNLISDTEVQLSDSISVYKVAQSLKTYSKCYSTTSPYRYTIPISVKVKKTGTPDGNLVVSLQSSSNNQPSGTTIGAFTLTQTNIASTFDVELGSIVLTNMLGSNTEYFMVVEPKSTASTVDFYSVEKSTTDTYIIGSLITYNGTSWNNTTGDMYFKIDIPNWIYNDYPRNELSKYSFPRVSVDMISRSLNQRWITAEIADYVIDFTIVAYSSYPNELDDVLSYADRAIFKERTKFNGMIRIDPGELTPTTVLRENLFSRAIRYQILYRMTLL